MAASKLTAPVSRGQIHTYKYLGSTLTSVGSLLREVLGRVNAAWMKWRSMTGVLCDKSIPERFKSKIYRTVVPYVAFHGVECWAATKEIERRLNGMEMKILRWMAGVTRLDRVCNQDVRQRFGVAPITEKVRKARLRWCGHVLRADHDSICKIGSA
ncbi:hypothetical protein Y032_0010g986 [Ancylostoma ceylanicum]|uniref:Reverse transcriptase domain-containing protein n=1 Tax=Ancylostoma ceylanicum TaxID=53326 RepID=A0A016VGS0_9BILA|nr:hypothetical protein Y032_0010g986 [Ancylostoma ceylanicum]